MWSRPKDCSRLHSFVLRVMNCALHVADIVDAVARVSGIPMRFFVTTEKPLAPRGFRRRSLMPMQPQLRGGRGLKEFRRQLILCGCLTLPLNRAGRTPTSAIESHY